MEMKDTIAQSLLQIGAIGFTLKNPITFKSGIISPVYVDNRKLPYHPSEWKQIIQGFESLIQEKKVVFDVVAGIETAGIPHSAALGFSLNMPSVFVRKAVKDHGTKKQVEGGSVLGKRVLLIEDHVTTGGSSLAGVSSLRTEGARVEYCFSITSYEFPEAAEAFSKEHIQSCTLTTFSHILNQAVHMKKIHKKEVSIIQDWIKSPHDWAKRYGYAK